MSETIDVISPTGVAGSMSAEEFAKRVAAGEQWQQESADERSQREFNEQAGLGTAVRAFVENAASAATLGGYDVAASYLGGDEYRKSREHADTYARHGALGGKILGLALPALVSGGAAGAAEGAVAAGAEGAAAAGAATAAEGGAITRGLLGLGRAVTAPVRGAAELGEGIVGGGEIAGHTVRGVLPSLGLTGESAGGRLALGTLKSAAGGAAEGALFGAGHAVSETALAPGGDYSHLAERALTGMGEGALFGAALGGSLSLAGSGVAKIGESIAPRLESLAGRSAIKAIAADRRAAQELLAAGDAEALGTRMLKDDIVAGRRSFEDTLGRAQAVKSEANSAMHDTASILDEAGAVPAVRPTFEKLQTEVLGPLSRSANEESKRVARALADPLAAAQQLAESGELSFGRLQELRDSMNPAKLWGSAMPPVSLQKGVTEIRNALDTTMRDEVKRAFSEVTPDELHAVALRRALAEEPTAAQAAAHADAFIASARDGGAARAFDDSDLSYRAARTVEDQITRRAADAGGSSKGIELTSNISALAAAKALMHGNPLGMAAGIATNIASKYIAKHGKSIVADLAYRVAQADAKIAGKVRALVGSGAEAQHAAITEAIGLDVDHALAKSAHETRGEAFQRTADAVRAGVSQNPMVADAEAPQTANAMRGVLQRGMDFLATKLPPGQQNPSPFYKPPPASAESVAKFAKYVQAVKDPLSILDSMQAGTVSSEQVEAIQAVYPRLYEQIKTTMSEQIQKRTTPLPESKSVQVGVLFGIPTIPLLEPGNYQVIQASYTVQLTPPKQGAAPSPPPSKISQSFATEAERLEGQELSI